MDENENNNLIDPDTMSWIQNIKNKASTLRELAESLDEESSNSGFNIQDVRDCFESVEEIFLELKTLLDPESEPEEPKDEA
jgi:hypothetical protein